MKDRFDAVDMGPYGDDEALRSLRFVNSVKIAAPDEKKGIAHPRVVPYRFESAGASLE